MSIHESSEKCRKCYIECERHDLSLDLRSFTCEFSNGYYHFVYLNIDYFVFCNFDVVVVVVVIASAQTGTKCLSDFFIVIMDINYEN